LTVDLTKLGVYCRCPGGQVETIPQQLATGVTWAALNLGSDPCVNRDPSVWAHQRALYASGGIPVAPWLHCRSFADVRYVVAIAKAWDSQFVGVNLEDVNTDGISLAQVASYLKGPDWGKPVHMATLPWVQNSAGWGEMAFATAALEMFPEADPRYLADWQGCVNHAFAEGLKTVTLLYSTQSPRSVYPNVAHMLYTADNVTDWPSWHDSVPQPVPKPPSSGGSMLSTTQFPYTGPCYGPGAKQTLNRPTVKGLKRAMIRLGFLNQQIGQETDDYGPQLKAAMARWQKSVALQATGNYGKGSWLGLRAQKIPAGRPHAGQWAMDATALADVREDLLTICYPHPLGSSSTVCQGLHQTAGIPGNWAIDFCAPGGTRFLAVERGTISRLSGSSPSLPPNNTIGIWGLSLYLKTGMGYEYFATHFGAINVKVGQVVECGQAIATVGSWPGDPGRSHTHLGVTSVKGEADAKAKITAVSRAARVAPL
jgi:hypothetical protein